jgi:hypothetical protein
MTRRGENPCLICRELASGPKGGTVCPECVRKVEAYDAMREQAHRGAVSIRLRQYPYVPSSSGGMRRDEKATQLENLLRDLRLALDRPSTRRGWGTWAAPGELAPEFEGKPRERGMVEDRDQTAFNVDARLAQFLLDLEPMIQHAIREAEENGKKQGSNLLAQLAAGELTSAEFEKRAGITR